MRDVAYPDVLVYLVESETSLRRALRDTLQNYGFGQVRSYDSIAQLQTALDDESPDLIICDNNVPDGDMNGLVRRLRHWQAGNNPFIPVITTTWDTSGKTVNTIAASGADLLLGKPLSPKDLMKRIDAIIRKRKPFVVTSDYIGPDRRQDASRDSDIPLIDVPNTLKAKMSGDDVAMSMDQEVRAAWRKINDERVGRNAFHAAFLVKLIMQDLWKPEQEDRLLTNIAGLVQTCRDTARRMRGGKFEHIGELFKRMYTLAQNLQKNVHDPDTKQIQLMEQLAMALNRAVDPSQEESSIARNITAAVSKYQKKQGSD